MPFSLSTETLSASSLALRVVGGRPRRHEPNLVHDGDDAADVRGNRLRLFALELPVRGSAKCDEAVGDVCVDLRGDESVECQGPARA